MDKTFTFSACVCYFFLEYNPCSIAKGGCEHFCQNNGGRVSCSCQEGFKLHPNMRNCRRKCISHMFCFVKGAVFKILSMIFDVKKKFRKEWILMEKRLLLFWLEVRGQMFWHFPLQSNMAKPQQNRPFHGSPNFWHGQVRENPTPLERAP